MMVPAGSGEDCTAVYSLGGEVGLGGAFCLSGESLGRADFSALARRGEEVGFRRGVASEAWARMGLRYCDIGPVKKTGLARPSRLI